MYIFPYRCKYVYLRIYVYIYMYVLREREISVEHEAVSRVQRRERLPWALSAQLEQVFFPKQIRQGPMEFASEPREGVVL